MSGPLFIGILNLTPDSFSDGGQFDRPDAAMRQTRRLAAAGAKMLDLGAESTRPGAHPVSPQDEWSRLEPVLEALRQALPEMPLSLDTRHADVAAKGLAMGASVINDVTGFSDPAMMDLVKHSRCGLIAMRSRRSADHFFMPEYGNGGQSSADQIIAEMTALKRRLAAQGIAPDRVMLDPGFGFGTTFNEDLALWNALPTLPKMLDWPLHRICLGLSRKRFLAWRDGTPEMAPDQRDGLTATAHTDAQAWGYRVFRTHAIP